MVLHPRASLVQVQAHDVGLGCWAAWGKHWLLLRAGFPFWNIEMWDKKEVFAGVLTAGRVAKVAFDKAGVPAQVLYHNHANFVSGKTSVLQTALNILQSQFSIITPW